MLSKILTELQKQVDRQGYNQFIAAVTLMPSDQIMKLSNFIDGLGQHGKENFLRAAGEFQNPEALVQYLTRIVQLDREGLAALSDILKKTSTHEDMDHLLASIGGQISGAATELNKAFKQLDEKMNKKAEEMNKSWFGKPANKLFR